MTSTGGGDGTGGARPRAPAATLRSEAAGAARGRGVAILLMCGAVALFACCDASAKWLNQSLDPMMTTWARYASNMVIVSLVLNPATTPGLLHSNRFRLQIVRSLLLLGCTALNFVALRYLQLTQTISIQFAMPLLVALLAGPFLGEWAGPRRLAAIGVGFAGILIVTRPFGHALHPAALFTVASTVLYALYAIVTRLLARHDRTATTVFYSGVAGFVLMTPVLPFVWSTPQGPLVWAMLVGIGLFAAIAHWLLVLAHARAPAPVLSPFIYTQIVWMAALGYLLFGDVPDRWTLVGAVVVIASGLYLLWWEREERRRAA